MSLRKTSLLRILLLGIVLFISSACSSQQPSLTGRWRDQSAAALLYEFRDDGSIWLLQDGLGLPVLRYEVKGNDLLQLYDGMGRQRELQLVLTTDRLVLRDASDPTIIFAEYQREP